MEILNLTPHDVNVHVLGNVRTIPPSGHVARVRTKRFLREAIEIGGLRMPVSEIESQGLENLPEEEPGRILIVSTFVAQHPLVRGRRDCIAPDTYSATRDLHGNIIAIGGFVRYS